MTYHPNDVARRARISSFLLMSVFLVLGAAFFRTQVIHHERYATQSEKNRLRVIPLPAPRGIIYDRNNNIIAENVPGYTVSLSARKVDSLRAALVRVSKHVPLSDEQIDRLAKRFTSVRPTVIFSDATFEQVALLEEHKISEFPGLVIQVTPKRYYPDGKAVASFMGYTREISDSELLTDRYKSYKAGQQIGSGGLEEQYDSVLTGYEGRKFTEVDSWERTVRTEGVRPVLEPVAGGALETFIDLPLQRYISDSVFADSVVGGVIVMDPRNGAVLAMHSGPSYDVNEFIGGISDAEWDRINKDPRNPQYNKVTMGRYAPASTYKLVTAILALEDGKVTMDEHMPVPCTGTYRFGNRDFHCWKRGGHGSVSLSGAIKESCNIYFFQLGQRLGLERLLGGGASFGFAAASGIDVPGEVSSFLPRDYEYYNRRYGPQGWSPGGETLNISIGQGAATQTVANVARFYSALATDGYAVRPRIAKAQPMDRVRLYDLTPAQNQGVRDALASVVASGTAAGSRIDGLLIAGKTGTAQAPQGADHGWFVGFAPAENPTLLVAMLIEHGLHGSTAARHVQKIFKFHFKEENILLSEIGG